MSLALKLYEARELVQDFILCICISILIQIRSALLKQISSSLNEFGSCLVLKHMDLETLSSSACIVLQRIVGEHQSTAPDGVLL